MSNENKPVLTEEQLKTRSRNRLTIIALVALFVLPMIVAFWLFKHPEDAGFGTKNKGDLIQPARPVEKVVLENVNDGSPFSLEDIKKYWGMVYFISGSCAEPCFEDLVKIRQSRLAQGGELKRIKRVVVLLDKQDSKTLKRMNEEHVGAIIVTGRPSELKKLTDQFEIVQAKSVREGKRIYLLDPIGNLFLKYEPEHTAGEIVKDLKRLLHVSQVG